MTLWELLPGSFGTPLGSHGFDHALWRTRTPDRFEWLAAKQQYRRDRISRTPLGSSRRRGRHLRSGRGTPMQPATGSTATDAMTPTLGCTAPLPTVLCLPVQ